MSVNIIFYTVFGIFLEDFNEEFSEIYDERYKQFGREVIFDGMCGEYTVLGNIHFSGDGVDGSLVRTTSLERMLVEWEEYKEEFIRVFPEFEYLITKEPSLISLVHYS